MPNKNNLTSQKTNRNILSLILNSRFLKTTK